MERKIKLIIVSLILLAIVGINISYATDPDTTNSLKTNSQATPSGETLGNTQANIGEDNKEKVENTVNDNDNNKNQEDNEINGNENNKNQEDNAINDNENTKEQENDTINNDENKQNEDNKNFEENVKQEQQENQSNEITEKSQSDMKNMQTANSNQVVSATGSMQSMSSSNNSKTSEAQAETATYNGSNNNYLSSIEIDGVELTADFNKEKLTYFATVEGLETITVTANAEDSSSKVAITGTNLKSGENKVLISVTAENGNVRYYRIYVTSV